MGRLDRWTETGTRCIFSRRDIPAAWPRRAGDFDPLWWWTEGGRTTLTARDLKWLFLLGLGVLGNHLLTLFGLRYVGAATAGVIIGASPAITALLFPCWSGCSFTTVAGGCAVSFAGVARGVRVGGDAPTGDNPWLGGSLVLLGLVSWALYSIGGRQVMERLSAHRELDDLVTFADAADPLLWTDRKLLVTGISVVPCLDGWPWAI